MSNWRDWGVYAATIVESATQPPSSNLNWNRVENDQYYPYPNNTNYFGPGLGCIQITSGQISFLKRLKDAGLIDNRYDSFWEYPSINFNNDDVEYLHKVLANEKAIEIQRVFTVEFFDKNNAYAMNAISNAKCPDIVKAYIMNMVILYPSYAYTLAQEPVGQTLSEAQNQMLQLLPSYANRFQIIKNYLETIDVNSKAPYSFWDGGKTENKKPNKPQNSSPAPGTPRPKENSGENKVNTSTAKNNVVLRDGYFREVLNTMVFMGEGNISLVKAGNGKNYIYRLPTITADTVAEQSKPKPNPTPPPAVKPVPDSSGSTNKKVDVSWLNQFVGQQLSYEGQTFGFGQCVAAGWFWLQHLGLNVNAKPNVNYAAEIQNLPWGTPPYDGFECLTNTNKVKAGDCIGFYAPWAPLPVGHYIIAAEDSDANGNFRFFEQNWQYNQPVGQVLRLAPNPIDTQYPGAIILSIVRKK